MHMMSNFLTSQLLSPYSSEVSNVIRYVSMVFGSVVLIYCLCSGKFKNKVQLEIGKIKEECERFSTEKT